MIRRQVAEEFWLIAQIDHAHLAGKLARHFGNTLFQVPQPFEQVVTAVAEHDAGWPLHDDSPTLNAKGLPLDVFETPWQIGLPVWSASADRAERNGPMTGLLVSLHSLALSVFAASSNVSMQHEQFDLSQQQAQFEFNKFQHREIERQERLRQKLGMRLDRPLKYGLADEGADEAEDRLRFNFRLLQAMDLCSLAICCTKPPADHTFDVHQKIGAPAIHMELRREGNDLLVEPWPFDVESITVQFPYRAIAARQYEVGEFRRELARAEVRGLAVQVRPEPDH